MQTHESYESAMQKKSWRSGGQSLKPKEFSMKSNNLECIINMEWLCETWRPCKTKSAQETPRSLRKFLLPEENPRSICTDSTLEFIKEIAKNWIRITRYLRRTDPKHMELLNELYEEWTKALRQYWFSLDFKKAGGQNPWSIVAIFETLKN